MSAPDKPAAGGVAAAGAAAGGGIALVGVLSALNLLDNAERSVLILLGPDIQRSLGFSDAALGGIVGLGAVVLTAGAIPIGLLADRRRRTYLAAAAAAIAAAFSFVTSMVATTAQLVLARIGAGAGQAAVLPVHNSLLVDGYPLQRRRDVLAVHNIAGPLGLLLAPMIAGGIAQAAGWRWAVVAFALMLTVAALAAATLREPPRGRAERESVLGADAEYEPPDPIPLEAGVSRLLAVQSLRYLLAGIGVLGFALVGVPTFFNRLLDSGYGLSALERGLVGSGIQLGVITGVVSGAVVGDRLFRRDPPSVVRMLAVALATHGVLATAALAMRPLAVLVVATAVAQIPLGMLLVPLLGYVAAVVPYRLRALGFATVGVCITLFGGFLVGVLLGDVSGRYGPRAAMLALTGPATLIAAALVARGSRFARSDLEQAAAEVAEEAAEAARIAAGGRAPLLQVRDLDVSYGPMQVLFGVDLDVWPGEVVALLGTNGAGKSTLLRAVTGLRTPSRGVVRLSGRTVTLRAAERRVDDGLALVAGGRGVFPSLTVAENLLAGAHTFVKDTAETDARAEEVLDLFPSLRERLDQRAGTLSGGEQQMLALAIALITRPRLLLVDELSLGLAPAVVADLFAVVERLRAAGVTIVLVEQSVNVALAVADRAVFLEKGRVRFTGTPSDLLERGDLVRAVFLGTGRDSASAASAGSPA